MFGLSWKVWNSSELCKPRTSNLVNQVGKVRAEPWNFGVSCFPFCCLILFTMVYCVYDWCWGRLHEIFWLSKFLFLDSHAWWSDSGGQFVLGWVFVHNSRLQQAQCISTCCSNVCKIVFFLFLQAAFVAFLCPKAGWMFPLSLSQVSLFTSLLHFFYV